MAQEVLKEKLKKQTAEGLGQPWPLKAENKKNLRLQHAAGAFDPGVKTRSCIEIQIQSDSDFDLECKNGEKLYL